MNIGIVCYPTFGGSGVVATELGKALAQKGHKVHFISYSQPVRLDSFSENIFYHEVSVSNYPLFDYQPYELVLASKLVDVSIFENLDLLHVHYAIPHASAAYMAQQILASKGWRVPFITTLHGTDITLVGKDASFEPVITFAISQSNAITSVSESLKRDTYKHFGVRKPIHVIPNFICIEDYTKLRAKIGEQEIEKHKKYYAPNKEKIMIHISNFRRVKRLEDVLKVFEKVRKEVPVKLLLLGDGPERPNIERMCRELDVCNDVRLLGKVVNPDDYLLFSDLFLLPSETESFGLAALEAMASRVPVISSNTGGIPEVNLHGFSGFLSQVGDVEDMAKNAVFILNNPEILQKFRKQAFEQALTFDIHKILPMYEKLYDEVVKENATIETNK
ncbi:MAG: N-acetyl-alpha-D-glucosaminyl L-malate synthase BshA [Bacteroidia bacterium]|nr:N-acetyl-alpha-D-glucosaminyl L-malate synthase BshA [Bacteroidia bacterium]MCZ2248142.1 N-acetyl-alpha-D-glucosaminyl L-malate synthase BshA [Bacteroidia bacterium]